MCYFVKSEAKAEKLLTTAGECQEFLSGGGPKICYARWYSSTKPQKSRGTTTPRTFSMEFWKSHKWRILSAPLDSPGQLYVHGQQKQLLINISDNDLSYGHVPCRSQLATAIIRVHEYSTAVGSLRYSAAVSDNVVDSSIKHSFAIARNWRDFEKL